MSDEYEDDYSDNEFLGLEPLSRQEVLCGTCWLFHAADCP